MRKFIAYALLIYFCLTLFIADSFPITKDETAHTTIYALTCVVVFILLVWFVFFRKNSSNTETQSVTATTIIFIIIIYIPGSAAIGLGITTSYFFSAGMAAGVIYPPNIISATCINSFKGRRSKPTSIFTTEDGSRWKVYGFKEICPTAPKKCSLGVSSGFYANKIHTITCKST
jgi:hypothetical protein